MRKYFSISCLLLLSAVWATTAQAQENPQIMAPLPEVKVEVGDALRQYDDSFGQYDDSLRDWSLSPERLEQILESGAANPNDYDEFRLNPSNEPLAARKSREFEWQRERFADRFADSIYPGFGRVETQHANGATSRLDYIYTRRCGVKGVGICWQYRF